MHDYQRHTLSNSFPHERKIKLKITNDVKPSSINRKQASPPVQVLVSDQSTSATSKQQHRQIDMLPYVGDVHQNGFHSPNRDPPSWHPKDLILHDSQSQFDRVIGEIFHCTRQIVLITGSISH